VAFNPEYAQAYCNIGYSYYQDATSLKENYKNYNSKDVLNKAILAFQRAIEIKPEYEIAFYKLAYAFLRVGQHRKAKKAFQKCILQMPKEIFLEPNEFSDKEIYEMIENCVPSSYEMQLDCHIHLAKWGWGSKQSKQWLINNNKTGETPNEIC
jgi:tetratricopeptide (TPR) repeat protein